MTRGTLSVPGGIARFRWLTALAVLAPAIAAVAAFPSDIPYDNWLFSNGTDVLTRNVCTLVLIPYVALFLKSLGTLVLPGISRPTSSIDLKDAALVQFFAGAGTLVVLGVLLGAARILYPWLAAAIFLIVLYAHLLSHADPFGPFLRWLRAGEAAGFTRAIVLAQRFAICLAVLQIVLEKAIVINLNQNDALQLYFPYFAEARRLHGIWLDPANPIIFSFFVGRGHGAHLFLSSFTDPFFIQALSVVYFLATALIVRRLVAMATPKNADTGREAALLAPIRDCAVLLALSSPMLQLDSGKFHFETGAFLTFLCWASLLVLVADQDQQGRLKRSLMLAAVALSLAVPQTAALAALICLVAWMASLRLPCARSGAVYGHTFLAACVAAGISLLLNQLYIGLAEINPYQMFIGFADEARFRQWSSIDLLVYVSNAQGFDYVNSARQVLQRLATSVGGLGDVGEIRSFRWDVSLPSTPLVLVVLLAAALRLGWLNRGKGGRGQVLDTRTDTLVAAFLGMFLATSILAAVSGHGSLQRLVGYLSITPAVFLGMILSILVGLPSKPAPLAWRALVVGMLTASMLFAAAGLKGREFRLSEWAGRLKREAAYVLGRGGLIQASVDAPSVANNMRRFTLCGKLRKLLPGNAIVAPLNSGIAMVPACLGFSIFEPGQMQDTLHFAFAPRFRQVMLDARPAAYATLKSYGIDYFLVDKTSPYFWALGVSESFSPDSIGAFLDVFYEDDDLYIFTWRKQGSGGPGPKVVETLRKLHEIGRKATPYYYEALKAL
jgi:hypothetical protein